MVFNRTITKEKYFVVYFSILSILLVSACDKKTEQQNQSTISVFGIGTVQAQPDMIQMSVTLSNVAQTTKLAQEQVSKMVRQVLAILKNENIEDRNINTVSLNFRSEYEYSSNRRVLVGQRAEQRISFAIDNINADNERAARIIDQLIGIKGIELNQINFSVKNSTEYFIKSRELAFQKAVEKANQYAKLSNLKIIKVLSISDEGNQQISPISNRIRNVWGQAETDFSGSTVIPAGDLEITTRISVLFLLE